MRRLHVNVTSMIAEQGAKMEDADVGRQSPPGKDPEAEEPRHKNRIAELQTENSNLVLATHHADKRLKVLQLFNCFCCFAPTL